MITSAADAAALMHAYTEACRHVTTLADRMEALRVLMDGCVADLQASFERMTEIRVRIDALRLDRPSALH